MTCHRSLYVFPRDKVCFTKTHLCVIRKVSHSHLHDNDESPPWQLEAKYRLVVLSGRSDAWGSHTHTHTHHTHCAWIYNAKHHNTPNPNLTTMKSSCCFSSNLRPHNRQWWSVFPDLKSSIHWVGLIRLKQIRIVYTDYFITQIEREERAISAGLQFEGLLRIGIREYNCNLILIYYFFKLFSFFLYFFHTSFFLYCKCNLVLVQR